MNDSKRTTRDHAQVHCYEHDELRDAKRVIIAGIDVEGFSFPQMPQMELRSPVESSPPIIVEKEVIVYVDRPVIVEKTIIERVEVPVIVKETVYEKVEVPFVVKETIIERVESTKVPEIKIVEIEKTVFVPQIQYEKIPLMVKAFVAVQALTSIIMLLKLLK